MDSERTNNFNAGSFPLHELVRVPTRSSIASNATAPNLPGPGRTMGLMLDWLGGHLEDFMNRKATRRGLGPEAVSREIRRLRHHHETTFLVRLTAPAAVAPGSEARSLKKLCDKLAKYTRSHVPSTQLKALEEIVDLTIEDPIIREALQQSRLSKLTPKYEDPDILIATSKALYSVTDTETHALWRRVFCSLNRKEGFYKISPILEESTRRSLE